MYRGFNLARVSIVLTGLQAGACSGLLAQPVLESPTPPQSVQPSITKPKPIGVSPVQMPSPVLPPLVSSVSTKSTIAEQIVGPPASIVVQQVPIVVPPGVAYEAPTGVSPGPNWAWAYHVGVGWGWHHPERGWQRGH